MRKALVVIALLGVPAVNLAAERMNPGRYPERAAVWKRFNVRDIQLGSEIDRLPGFTCDSSVGQFKHSCVQFVDERCKGRKSVVRVIRSGTEPPQNQTCHYDPSAGGFWLDGNYMTTPLSAVVVVGTDTYVPRAYEIRFTFAKDLLTDNSNIGRALLTKYGRPDYAMPPKKMRWQAMGIEDLYLEAECGGIEGPTGDYCSVSVHDGGFLDAERAVKAAFDTEQQRKNAPPAPRL